MPAPTQRLEHERHEFRAAYPVGFGVPGAADPPSQRHPVGKHQPGMVVNGFQARVAVALHDAMNAADADIAALTFDDPSTKFDDGESRIYGTHADAENIDGRDHVDRPV